MKEHLRLFGGDTILSPGTFQLVEDLMFLQPTAQGYDNLEKLHKDRVKKKWNQPNQEMLVPGWLITSSERAEECIIFQTSSSQEEMFCLPFTRTQLTMVTMVTKWWD
eukprot:sb/3477752/